MTQHDAPASHVHGFELRNAPQVLLRSDPRPWSGPWQAWPFASASCETGAPAGEHEPQLPPHPEQPSGLARPERARRQRNHSREEISGPRKRLQSMSPSCARRRKRRHEPKRRLGLVWAPCLVLASAPRLGRSAQSSVLWLGASLAHSRHWRSRQATRARAPLTSSWMNRSALPMAPLAREAFGSLRSGELTRPQRSAPALPPSPKAQNRRKGPSRARSSSTET